jgi:hypothetical protein
MTTRIYIRGDVGDPMNVHIFDADTDLELEISYFVMDMTPKGVTASITPLHSSAIRVDVVPAPPVPHAGKSLREVELTQFRRDPPQAPYGCTIHKATATEWIVQPDGSVEPNLKTQAYQQHEVDDVVLASYAGDPRDVLEDSARVVLTGIANFLISPLLSTGVAPLATGGVYTPQPTGYRPGRPNPNIPGPNFKIQSTPGVSPGSQDPNRSGKLDSNSKAVCSECGGSGEYTCPISHKKSKCSLGCKRPDEK